MFDSGAKGGDDSTLATDVSSEFCHQSLASSSSKQLTGRRRHSVDNADDVRTKYLHRLGFGMAPNSSERVGAITGQSGTSKQRMASSLSNNYSETSVRLSCSLDDRLLLPTPTPQRRHQERLILLRRSEQYTVDLKFDETPIEAAKPKFELSSAWTNFLSSSFHASEPSQSCKSEPLDGAYDLFSLPSDSSFNTKPTSDMAFSSDSATTSSFLRRESSKTSRSELSNSAVSRRPPRKVSFDSTVIATTIPSRFSYSERIRSRLWSSTDDIYSNAIRNEHEFAYDHSDWRTATEEAEFVSTKNCSGYLSAQEGLVHPYHVSGHSRSTRATAVACHYEETDVLDSSIHTSIQGGDVDEDDAFESGIFTME